MSSEPTVPPVDAVPATLTPKKGRKRKTDATDTSHSKLATAVAPMQEKDATSRDPVVFHLRAHAADATCPTGTLETCNSGHSGPEPTAFNEDDAVGAHIEPALLAPTLLQQYSTDPHVAPNEVMNGILQNVNSRRSYSEGTACFWDCCTFVGPPVQLLMSYNASTGVYIGTGHFCSPHCAVAYLLDMYGQSDHDKWVRLSLMTAVYGEAACLPAPSRQCLRLFDGPLSIEQFRSHHGSSSHSLQASMPPVRMTMPVLEMVASDRLTMGMGVAMGMGRGASGGTAGGHGALGTGMGSSGLIPLDEGKVKAAAKQLKIKRSKATVDASKTLMGKLQLKVGSTAATAGTTGT